MKKFKYVIAAAMSALLLCGCQSETDGEPVVASLEDSSAEATADESSQAVKTSAAGDQLEVHYIDVGQGDASLIMLGDYAMLIDGGNNDKGELVRDYLLSQGVESLDYIVATHPDADHIGGLDIVMQGIDTEMVLYPDYEKDTMTYYEVIDEIEEQGITWEHPEAGTTYELGDASFTVLAPQEAYSDANNGSIVLMLEYGSNRFLFAADAEMESINDMLDADLDLEANVYKINHHGSAMAFSEDFLELVDPQYAVISCGEDNSYGHPHWEVLAGLEDNDVITYRTDLQGTLIALSDGNMIEWKFPDSSETAQEELETDSNTTESIEETYIVNTNTRKFHLPDCSGVSSMKEENKAEMHVSAEELLEQGYEACKNCNP